MAGDTSQFWKVIQPESVTSKKGDDSLEPRGTVVIGGKFPDYDDSAVTLPVKERKVNSPMALTNDSLQYELVAVLLCSHRSRNFAQAGAEPIPVKLSDAKLILRRMDLMYLRHSTRNLSRWAVWDGQTAAVDRQAIFTLAESLEIPELQVVLSFAAPFGTYRRHGKIYHRNDWFTGTNPGSKTLPQVMYGDFVGT